jgi:hypothetical protein
MAAAGTAAKTRLEIILVGVVHGDPQGYNKAMALLEELRPAAVGVEISRYSWDYRRRWVRRWQEQFRAAQAALPPAHRQHLALQRLAAQIALPFEVRAAAAYARCHRRVWAPLDINAISREHLPRYHRELLTPENLRHLTADPDGSLAAFIRREYDRAVHLLGRPGAPWPRCLAVDPQSTMREKVLAHRLRRLAQQWSRVVHFGGWEHLIYTGGHHTLADLLAPWEPQRLLLSSPLTDFGKTAGKGMNHE